MGNGENSKGRDLVVKVDFKVLPTNWHSFLFWALLERLIHSNSSLIMPIVVNIMAFVTFSFPVIGFAILPTNLLPGLYHNFLKSQDPSFIFIHFFIYLQMIIQANNKPYNFSRIFQYWFSWKRIQYK